MKFWKFLNYKLLTALIVVFLFGLYGLLIYHNPYKTNNLIPNLEPYPDTMYYSVPAWNWLNGKGFKMALEGKEIHQDVPPLYGLMLMPFFKLFGDVRSYYYANVILGVLTLMLFFRLVWFFFKDSKIKPFILGLTGLVLVTNFYFYNLPTLMMAENPQILLILAAMNVLIANLSIGNLLLTIGIAVTMLLTKMSNLPVIACMIMWTFIKILKTRFWKKYDKKLVVVLIVSVTLLSAIFFYKFIYQNRGLFINGEWWFSLANSKKFFPYYASEFLGITGRYLWYNNLQIEAVAGWVALTGIVVGLLWKKYREKTLIFLSIILAVIAFHSCLFFPEGRYISVVIPLYVVFIGMIPELLSKIKNWFGVMAVVLFSLVYLGSRQNINEFKERKITSIKRQIMNNQLSYGEDPWNYKAIENYNKYFSELKQKDVYLGSLLPPFMYMYFGDRSYQYIPISDKQDFGVRGLSSQLYAPAKNLEEYYDHLLKDNKNIYVSNYYIGNNTQWQVEFRKIQEKYNLIQVADGCLGECKIYKVELKNEKK